MDVSLPQVLCSHFRYRINPRGAPQPFDCVLSPATTAGIIIVTSPHRHKTPDLARSPRTQLKTIITVPIPISNLQSSISNPQPSTLNPQPSFLLHHSRPLFASSSIRTSPLRRNTAKLAQSRPPPTRSHAAASPPLSPRTLCEKPQHEKRSHHVRRKSGNSRDEKKRPATLSRRTTPQYVKTLGTGARAARDREREREDDAGVRDSGESFPQFWYVDLRLVSATRFLPASC